jgi:heme a synthase
VRLPRISPPAYRRITLGALVALGVIIVTGAAVRLTGSGLGCPDWPTCEQGQLVAPLEYHAMIEFLNRVFTGVVSVAVMLAVLGSLLRVPRRRDLTRLALGLVAGVLGQIALGAITVLFHLWPPIVMAHFLLSMVLLWNAVVLHHRAGRPPGPPRPVVGPAAVRLARALFAMGAVVLVTGTVVTGTGPHGGDEHVDRLPFLLPEVARLHGGSVVVFVGLTVALAWLVSRRGAPAELRRALTALLAVSVAQAAVGYVQYFSGVPVLLVAIHIVGAIAVWTAATRVLLATHQRAGSTEDTAPADPAPPAVLART